MGILSTGLSRDERGGGCRSTAQQIDDDPPPDRVRSIRETALLLSLGEPSLRNMIARGEGPKVTRLSARRIGVRDSHRKEWLDAQIRE
jgi:predicted DNA-binding transcriptional regulator AlpA